MKNEFSSLNTAQGDSVVLSSVHASGRLDGLLLTMTLRQVFRNDQSENLEVTYTFPLAWGAVLLGLEATLGGKRMAGRVVARRDARERYQEAVEKGDAPIMVEKATGGVFSASLGSLKPGEEAEIELTYAQLLSFEQGRIRLVVPTTIAPRYGDAVKQGGIQPDQVAAPDLLAEQRFGLSVTLFGPVAYARVGSPSHAITQQRNRDATSETVTVSLQGQAWLDRDFVLLLEGFQGRSFAIAGPDTRSGEGHVALIASYCPALSQAEPAPLRLKILVDCSGSMAGESIAQARDAMRPLAAELTAEDQVSYSRFGNKPQRVLGALDATSRNIKVLVNAINETQASLGGTEMAAALEDTFAVRMSSARYAEEADVLLITDGEVWDAQRIVDHARRSGHRIYALGVGSAPAESLLREMAEATGGACEFAVPGEDMGNAVKRLLSSIRLALPVRAHLGGADSALWSSPLPHRLAPGETVHAFMRLSVRQTNAPVLQLIGQDPEQAELSLREDDLVARLVAARTIGLTADRAQALELAEKYQLVTDETNLLLVIERADADKTDGMPALYQARSMLASGWGGTGLTLLSSSNTTHHSSILGTTSDDIPFSASVSSVPSVWRTNRTASAARISALKFDDMDDDFEIPAFLRKQLGNEQAPASPALQDLSIGTSARPSAQQRAARITATSAQIIDVFNQAATHGRPFRVTLRAITTLSLESRLYQTIEDAGRQVGGPLKAWACFLLWLHQSGPTELRLHTKALMMIEGQVQSLNPEARAHVVRAFGSSCLPD